MVSIVVYHQDSQGRAIAQQGREPRLHMSQWFSGESIDSSKVVHFFVPLILLAYLSGNELFTFKEGSPYVGWIMTTMGHYEWHSVRDASLPF